MSKLTPPVKTKRVWFLMQQDIAYDKYGNEKAAAPIEPLAFTMNSGLAQSALDLFAGDEKRGGAFRTVTKAAKVEPLAEEQEASTARILRLVRTSKS